MGKKVEGISPPWVYRAFFREDGFEQDRKGPLLKKECPLFSKRAFSLGYL